jgi:hypothetical protein
MKERRDAVEAISEVEAVKAEEVVRDMVGFP